MRRFAAAIVIVVLQVVFAAVIHAQDTAPAVGVRYSVAPETVRVVLDLPAETTFTDKSIPTALQFITTVPLEKALSPIKPTDPIVSKIEVVPSDAGNAALMISLAKARKYKVFTLPAGDGKPFRLVVDVLKRFSTEDLRDLSPFIKYARIESQTDERYLAAHFVSIDAKAPGIRLTAVTAQGDRERVSAMVTRTGAALGVNGGYFLDGTRPVGLLKVEGRIVSLPLWGRTVLAFPESGPPALLNPQGTWKVTLPDGTVRELPDALEASVQTPPPAAIVINGNNFCKVAPPADGLAVIIHDGKVASRLTAASPLAPGEFGLQLCGDEAKTLDAVLVEGAEVAVAPAVSPDLDAYQSAIGAGPRLLRKGEIEVTGDTERFKPDILQGRHARTALGITAEGRVILAVVEAPCPFGGGATLEEMAAMLKARGAVDAINLDGGGSTALAIGPDTLNYPAGTWIRPVATGVLVYTQPTAVAGKTQ